MFQKIFYNPCQIIGSSIIRNSGTYLEKYPFQSTANFQSFWDGVGGLTLFEMEDHMKRSPFNFNPKVIVIHVGGNDIGTTELYHIMKEFKRFINLVLTTFPNTDVFYSEILYRFSYRTNHCFTQMDKTRRQVNKKASIFCKKNSRCHFISHPNITADRKYFDDEVHLSNLGNRLFINNIYVAIKNYPHFKE